MKLASVIIFISFASLSIFGLLGMNSAHNNMCVATMANMSKGVGCPVSGAGFSMALFHISALKSFSTAILSFGFTVFLASLVVLLFLTPLVFRTDSKLQGQFVSRSAVFLNPVPPQDQELKFWFSLHENSPSIV